MTLAAFVDSPKQLMVRLWLVALTIQTSLTTVLCGKGPHHRRSLIGHGNLPASKGGWRPVVGSGGLLYGSLGTAPLHAPSYKIPGLDYYPSSARPLTTRDITKLTSIAQSYRPTTLRTVQVSSHPLQSNQPINSYLNPFSLPNNGLNQYKFVQNFPVDSVLIRNQHNPYAARPVLQKHQTKQKQQYHNNILQQLTNVQPIQFGQYSTVKALDLFGKPIEAYPRPDGKRPHSAETEIFKPEVFKLPDTDTASQYINHQVKTAQQQTYSLPKLPINQYGHPFQDNVFPPSILGTFGSFGLQSVKGRDPVYPTTKTTFLPPQTTKQTIFNSFNYSPSFKTTQSLFSSTTPKLTTTQNFNLLYGSTLNDLGNVPTPQTKVVSPLKIDPNAETKHGFKPSPQDPFIKNYQNLDFNKITTYNPPIIQTSTLSSGLFNNYDFHSQNIPFQNYKNQNNVNNNYDNTKQVSDNVGLTQQVSQQYVNAPGLFDLESSLNALAHRPSYAVVENVSEDVITNASPAAWTVTPHSYKYNQKESDESVTKHEHVDNVFEKPTTPLPNLPEEFAIVTEAEKTYENGYNYENQFESQSRRPLGDDFEPIGKNKLKDYYYKVSTPTYNDHKTYRRTKKPTTELRKLEVTTSSTINQEVTDVPVETLPTLPPNKHFKRPSTSDNLDRDKIRKRNKIRRRRPSLANRNREETSTRNDVTSTENTFTTITEETHTIRPRTRPSKARPESGVTTPSETTELTTSALPTTSPTKPTIVKKKLIGHRRPLTTVPDKIETTTQPIQDYNSRESSIMKISSRPQLSKSPLNTYEFKNSEIPDYSHKQDEKDTPTSDVSVSLTDALKTNDALKEFSFHRDVRPVENKDLTTESVKEKNEHEATTFASRTETNTRQTKIQRPRLKNKQERPKFSVKDYRNRLNSTTSTTEKIVENTPKSRYPQRKNPYSEIFTEVETTTERKKFTPKEPRHKLNRTENNEQEIHSRQTVRQRQNSEGIEGSTQKISSRIRTGQRRTRPTEEPSETSSQATIHNKRPLRKRIQDSDIGESVQDLAVTETTVNEHKNDITSERTRSESAIMKIADKKHQDHIERLFEHSKRVSDLTLAASKDYNTPGMFKTIASNSRRIPSYFTIATDDPILPIEAFFPQLNQKKES
ncbi:uncharacterized protein LOC125070665 [Vanessa atalanta]|uniref:uncharacterized protein LOC125070665 n=1 Tax=Vanessa atalanta TaxID=42275 RepID=UPI001FCD772E|nr:uncharacterized protein LOC125070665 [Vanessa atalanta]